jgi:hypothetical protein
VTYAEMPAEAEDVMRTIRWWMKRDPSGPTLRQLRCTCKSYVSAERGLRLLKARRAVRWTDEGAATRYAARKAT